MTTGTDAATETLAERCDRLTRERDDALERLGAVSAQLDRVLRMSSRAADRVREDVDALLALFEEGE